MKFVKFSNPATKLAAVVGEMDGHIGNKIAEA